MNKEVAVEIGVYYFPYNETSVTFVKDRDWLQCYLDSEKRKVLAMSSVGKPMTLFELLKELGIDMEKPEYAVFMVMDLIWFESPEGWFVGAVSMKVAQD